MKNQLLARARRHWKLVLLGGAMVASLAGALISAGPPAQAQSAAYAPNSVGADSGVGGAAGAVAQAPQRSGNNVRIVFKVIPPTRATVTWGKKKLGLIKPKGPLTIERPRDSGPLDVVVRADGCVPVHTRAYTFTDTTVAVKVTPVDKKNTIFGYREEVPPEETDGGVAPVAGNPDAGAPPTP